MFATTSLAVRIFAAVVGFATGFPSGPALVTKGKIDPATPVDESVHPPATDLAYGVTEAIYSLSNHTFAERACVERRNNINLSGQNCASTCSGEAGSGPNEADCEQLINAMYLLGTNTFTIGPYSGAKWILSSCTIAFDQATDNTVTYQYNLLGSVANYLSGACNAAHGYGRGDCVFNGLEIEIVVANSNVVS